MSAMLSAMRTLTDPANTAAVYLPAAGCAGRARDYPLSFFARRVHHIERRPPDPQRLARAQDLIARKHRPLVVAVVGALFRCA
jgi:3D-(3,5/4)-trihydroxycyclohexane-1,2-dione acylhydrolase (decyclizing)